MMLFVTLGCHTGVSHTGVTPPQGLWGLCGAVSQAQHPWVQAQHPLCQDVGDELVEALRVLLGVHRGDLGPRLRRDHESGTGTGDRDRGEREGRERAEETGRGQRGQRRQEGTGREQGRDSGDSGVKVGKEGSRWAQCGQRGQGGSR